MVHKEHEKPKKITGRLQEKRILDQLLNSNKAEFLALYGRRRIGKTFLIRNFFTNVPCTFFHATGIQDGKIGKQIAQFCSQIGTTFYFNDSLLPL